MSSATSLLTELTAAANELDKLGAYEMAHLLEQSIITIFEMREHCGVRIKRHAKDPLMDLRNVQGDVMRGFVVHDQVSAALYGAPDMIFDLNILLETKRDDPRKQKRSSLVQPSGADE